MIIAQIPPEILSAIPSKWLVYVNASIIAAAIIGRICHAISDGGGLIGIWRGLLYGTNTPTQKQQEEKVK